MDPVFVVSNFTNAMLGANFLTWIGGRHERRCFTNTTTSLRVHGVVLAAASPSPALNPATPMEAIVSEFPLVTQPCVATTPMKHNITHYVTTIGPPVSAWTHRLSPERLRVGREEFNHMLVPRHHLAIIQLLVLTTTHGAKEDPR